MEYNVFNIKPFTVRYSIDAAYLCRHSMYNQKQSKHSIVFLLVFLGLLLLQLIRLHVWFFLHNGYLYLPYALPTMLLLVFWAASIRSEYRLLRKNKMPKTSQLFWQYVSRIRFHNHIECNYYFSEQFYTLSYTHAHTKRKRKLCKIRKLYITDDIIFDGFSLYIERSSVTEEEFVYIQKFLERRVPAKRISHKLP
jgi:hypothetical protein